MIAKVFLTLLAASSALGAAVPEAVKSNYKRSYFDKGYDKDDIYSTKEEFVLKKEQVFVDGDDDAVCRDGFFHKDGVCYKGGFQKDDWNKGGWYKDGYYVADKYDKYDGEYSHPHGYYKGAYGGKYGKDEGFYGDELKEEILVKEKYDKYDRFDKYDKYDGEYSHGYHKDKDAFYVANKFDKYGGEYSYPHGYYKEAYGGGKYGKEDYFGSELKKEEVLVKDEILKEKIIKEVELYKPKIVEDEVISKYFIQTPRPSGTIKFGPVYQAYEDFISGPNKPYFPPKKIIGPVLEKRFVCPKFEKVIVIKVPAKCACQTIEVKPHVEPDLYPVLEEEIKVIEEKKIIKDEKIIKDDGYKIIKDDGYKIIKDDGFKFIKDDGFRPDFKPVGGKYW